VGTSLRGESSNAPMECLAAYQLVGEVTAHQGNDG
jgi:hypothetical protein